MAPLNPKTLAQLLANDKAGGGLWDLMSLGRSGAPSSAPSLMEMLSTGGTLGPTSAPAAPGFALGMANSGALSKPQTAPLFKLGNSFPGMVAPGNLDLNARTVYRGANDYRTENSFSIGTDAGEVLIPTVVNGKQLSEQEAIDHFKQTGENLGTFSDPQSADTYAEMLHKRQEIYYAPKAPQPAAMSPVMFAARKANGPTY